MNDRQQAIDVLRRARDMLADRITERVLAQRDEIFEDALGLAPASEIDSLYEQLGVRLAHLNHLLSNMPAEEGAATEKAATVEAVPTAESAEELPSENFHREHAAQTEVPAPHLALPAPGEVLQLAGPPPVVSFQRFATRIFLGDLDGAGLVLAELFEIEPGRARKCAQVFYDGVRHNPEVIAKTAQLRRELQSGGYATALMLLHECFGLQGIESISVMQSLRARIERSTY
jgi:hypothetical protein